MTVGRGPIWRRKYQLFTGWYQWFTGEGSTDHCIGSLLH